MKESIRGYVEAVLEEAEPAGTVATLAAELAGISDLVAGSADLRSVLEDPGIAVHVRRSVVADLLGGRVGDDALRVVTYAIEEDRAPEVPDDLAWMAERVAAARDGLRSAFGTVVGRHAATARLEGYAAAVLAPVREEGVLSDVEDELFRFARTVAGYPELADALTGPTLAPEAREAIVTTLLADKATPASTRLAAYAARISRPRDYLELLDGIVARVALETQRRIAEVRAVVELTEDQQQRLAAALGRLSGQDVEVRVTVDPTVLGGFVATMGDTVVDASVRHRLELLRERLALSDAPTGNPGPDGPLERDTGAA